MKINGTNLTKEEAHQALLQGCSLTHELFVNGESIAMEAGDIYDENGYIMNHWWARIKPESPLYTGFEVMDQRFLMKDGRTLVARDTTMEDMVGESIHIIELLIDREPVPFDSVKHMLDSGDAAEISEAFRCCLEHNTHSAMAWTV